MFQSPRMGHERMVAYKLLGSANRQESKSVSSSAISKAKSQAFTRPTRNVSSDEHTT
jgi:hypothetical protein